MNVGHIYRYYNRYGEYYDYVFVYEISDMYVKLEDKGLICTICAMGVNIADSTDIRTLAKEVWRHWEEVET